MFMNWFRNKYPYTDFHELNFDAFITEFKGFVEALSKLDEWVTNHEEEYKELKEAVDKLMSGDFTPEFVEALLKWCRSNMEEIFAEFMKMVFFGLTDDGYFIAYIPESWDEITFGTTGLDDFPEGIDYGHLTLSY